MHDLILTGAFFVPLMTLILGILGPLRRAITRLGDSYAKSAAEKEAKAALDFAEAEESRHKLAVRREHLPEEVRFEQARLAAETAQFEVDAEAARKCLPVAVEARQVALRARADAEAALAPEAAKAALEGDGEWLAEAYAAYCENYQFADPLPFGRWIQGFNGARRG